MMKQCTKCGQIKSLSEFSKCNSIIENGYKPHKHRTEKYPFNYSPQIPCNKPIQNITHSKHIIKGAGNQCQLKKNDTGGDSNGFTNFNPKLVDKIWR